MCPFIGIMGVQRGIIHSEDNKLKKRSYILIALCLALSMLSGCGKEAETKDVNRDTVFIDKKGKISEFICSDFTADYYDKDELEDFINERVDAYTDIYGKETVEVAKFGVDDGVAKLTLNYYDSTDYAEFNGVTFFSGSVVEAQADGYKFSDGFVSVEEGVIGASAAGSEISTNEKLKCVIIGQDTDVSVAGKIVYVSDGNVEVMSESEAHVTYDSLSADPQIGYIVYN